MDFRLRRTVALASLVLLTTVGLVACSDDTAGTDGDENVDSGMPTDTDGDTITPDGGPTDVSPDEGTDATDPDSGNKDDVEPDSSEDDAGEMDVAPDTPPGNDGGFENPGTSSHVTQVTYRQSESESPDGCCRDFDGDGDDDSALGDLVEGLSEFTDFTLSDITASTNARLSNGDLVFLFEFGQGWMSAMNDSGFDFFTHTGVSKPTPWDTDGDNVPEFEIDPSSLDNQGQPKSSFGMTSVSGASLSASNGELFFELTFGSSSNQVTVQFTLYQAELTADVDTANTSLGGGGEAAFTNGEISGIVNDDDLFNAVNELLKQQCSCLNNQNMFGNNGSGRYSCQNTCSSGSFQCSSIGCSSSRGIIYENYADADADGQGGNDDFTFGMEFKAEGADITGVGSP